MRYASWKEATEAIDFIKWEDVAKAVATFQALERPSPEALEPLLPRLKERLLTAYFCTNDAEKYRLAETAIKAVWPDRDIIREYAMELGEGSIDRFSDLPGGTLGVFFRLMTLVKRGGDNADLALRSIVARGADVGEFISIYHGEELSQGDIRIAMSLALSDAPLEYGLRCLDRCMYYLGHSQTNGWATEYLICKSQKQGVGIIDITEEAKRIAAEKCSVHVDSHLKKPLDEWFITRTLMSCLELRGENEKVQDKLASFQKALAGYEKREEIMIHILMDAHRETKARAVQMDFQEGEFRERIRKPRTAPGGSHQSLRRAIA